MLVQPQIMQVQLHLVAMHNPAFYPRSCGNPWYNPLFCRGCSLVRVAAASSSSLKRFRGWEPGSILFALACANNYKNHIALICQKMRTGLSYSRTQLLPAWDDFRADRILKAGHGLGADGIPTSCISISVALHSTLDKLPHDEKLNHHWKKELMFPASQIFCSSRPAPAPHPVAGSPAPSVQC